MQVILLDTDILLMQIVETGGGDEWHNLLKCDLIDITTRSIAGREYDLICDDEALLKTGGKVTALSSKGDPVLVGNVIICNFDEETGEERGLTPEDMEHIRQNIVILTEDTKGSDREPQRWLAINNCDYC